MAKMQLNDDGTVTLPLANAPDGTPRQVILPEPTLAQIGELRKLATAADEALPQLDTIDPAAASPAEADTFSEQLAARTELIFSGDESPHGKALLAAIEMLTGDVYTAADLPAWAGSPRALGGILAHFQAPLAGPA